MSLFESPAPHRDLHSFPTRRSSDLVDQAVHDHHPECGERQRQLRERREQTVHDRVHDAPFLERDEDRPCEPDEDRKSTRLNSSHITISYAVFCLKKKKKKKTIKPNY